MTNDITYKASFIFALVVHVILISFLFTKSVVIKSEVVAGFTNSIINATVISERDFNKQTNKKKIIQKKVKEKKKLSKPVVKKKKIEIKKKAIAKKTADKENRLQSTLKKNLLLERKREIEEIKKERIKHEKEIIEKRAREEEMLESLNDEILAEQKELTGARGALVQGRIDEHAALIKHEINSYWIKPDGVTEGEFSEWLINVAPGGVVMDVKLLKSSGNVVLDRSAKAAVLKASPLPVPEDAELFNEVRVIKIMFKPEGLFS